MSTKNNRILSPDGGRYPFKVSDEYFDNLTARIMERISEEDAQEDVLRKNVQEDVSEKNTKIIDMRQHRRRNTWLSVASIAASLVLIATVALKFIPTSTTQEQPADKQAASYTDEDYNEDLMTYTMVDNMDVYYYLASGDMDEE